MTAALMADIDAGAAVGVFTAAIAAAATEAGCDAGGVGTALMIFAAGLGGDAPPPADDIDDSDSSDTTDDIESSARLKVAGAAGEAGLTLAAGAVAETGAPAGFIAAVGVLELPAGDTGILASGARVRLG